MSEPDFQDFDLLGDPIPGGFGGRGRPPHNASREKAITIMLLVAVGKNKKQIAAAVGVTQPTLNRYYFSPDSAYRIRMGECRNRVEAKLLANLYAAAVDGNVAANKAIWDRLEKADLKTLSDSYSKSAGAKREKPVSRGKKEQLQADAEIESSQGLYSTPSAPGHVKH